MPTTDSTKTGRRGGPLSGVAWGVSTPNTVAFLGLAALILLLALRTGFRPVNIA